jgi:hypothetical protein
MAEESSAFTSSTNWDHEEQRGSSQFSLCKDLQGVCTQTNIKFNQSFEDVSQAILLTSPGRKDFPQACQNGLKQGLLEPFRAIMARGSDSRTARSTHLS